MLSGEGIGMRWIGDMLAAALTLIAAAAIAVLGFNWLIPRLGPDDYVTVYQRTCYPKKGIETEMSYYDCKRSGGSTMVISST